jgi:hypothetical protein
MTLPPAKYPNNYVELRVYQQWAMNYDCIIEGAGTNQLRYVLLRWESVFAS